MRATRQRRTMRPMQMTQMLLTLTTRAATLATFVFAGGQAMTGCASAPPTAQATPAAGPLHFIEDDYAKALARARAEHKPLFIDTWATWCHSCLALKVDVFTDPALAPEADRFVWLSLDVERPSSAPFLARYPSQALPTLYVIDPSNETAVLRWLGTLTAPQLAELLTDASQAMSGGSGVEATQALIEGEQLAAAGKLTEARSAWDRALRMAPERWSKRARAANGLVYAMSHDGDNARCAEVALAETTATERGQTGRVDLAISGLGCAAELDAKDPRREEILRALIGEARAMAIDPGLLNDDRSGAYSAVVDAYKALGDTVQAKQFAGSWSEFVDQAAAAAKTPAARAALDPHRVYAYVELGQGERALPMLAQSERDFPDDYNAPARAAFVLFKLGRFDEALAATARAEAHIYGPRRLRIASVKADIFEALHNPERALEALDEAIAAANALPDAQRPLKTLSALAARRNKLAASMDPSRNPHEVVPPFPPPPLFLPPR